MSANWLAASATPAMISVGLPPGNTTTSPLGWGRARARSNSLEQLLWIEIGAARPGRWARPGRARAPADVFRRPAQAVRIGRRSAARASPVQVRHALTAASPSPVSRRRTVPSPSLADTTGVRVMTPVTSPAAERPRPRGVAARARARRRPTRSSDGRTPRLPSRRTPQASPAAVSAGGAVRPRAPQPTFSLRPGVRGWR